MTTCGDGELDPSTEECDGAELSGLSCRALGFQDGTLACSETCELDVGACKSPEDCSDGDDDDLDGDVDCADSECSAVCKDACASPALLGDPSFSFGQTSGHPSLQTSSCAEQAPSGSGPEVVYRVTAASSGRLEARLTSNDALTVSIRASCGAAGSERGCGERRASASVDAGETVFVMIDGADAESTGSYALEVFTRPGNVCGDGARDDEECDDGNQEPNDGCSATCTLESGESEGNDSAATATPFSSPMIGSIAPGGDVDVYLVEVTVPGSTLLVTLGGFGGYSCALGDLDGYLEIYGADGATLLASDDDGGERHCDELLLAELAAGSYYVVVRASPLGRTPAFVYELRVDVGYCGDGKVGPDEDCDDGNDDALDGCAACLTP